MRIAFVSTILSYPWGGADALWTRAAEAAVERGDSVLMAITESTAQHKRVAALLGKGAKLHIRPAPAGPLPLWKRVWRKAPWIAEDSAAMNDRIRAFAPDLVVFSCGGTYDAILEPALTRWLRASTIPYRIIANFQNEHPAMAEPDRLSARDVLDAADRILCVSPRNLEVTRLHLHAPLPNAELVHYPLRAGSPLPWAESETYSLACLARLEPVKGLDILFPALAQALGAIPGWTLNIYGNGPQKKYLEGCVAYCGLSGRVNFKGYVEDIDEIWRQNHLLVSSAIDEGVPLILPEAMLRGRAVLATRVGGAAEWIEDGRTGFLCPAPTAALMADTLRRAWEERQRWKQMGEDAAVFAHAFYRPEDYRRIIA